MAESSLNTVGKGEIACYTNFSFSLIVFKRLILQTHKNKGLFGKGLTPNQNLHKIYVWSKLKAFAEKKFSWLKWL